MLILGCVPSVLVEWFWLSGNGCLVLSVDCRVLLSVVVLGSWLSGRMSGVAVGGLLLVSSCWCRVFLVNCLFLL